MTATIERPPAPAPPPAPKATKAPRRRSELNGTDKVVRALLLVAAIIPTFALSFLAFEMVKEAFPAIVFNGWKFFTTKTFTFGNLYGGAPEVRHGYQAAHGAQYGVLPLIFGTVVSSLIALVFAVPISILGAILLVEKLPARLQGPLGVTLELLAGIPSVIFGLWGVYTFGPLLSRTVYKWIASLGIPWFDGPTGAGQGLLTASLVLAVMIIPIIASITRELIRSVPKAAKEGAAALGLTGLETVRAVILPYSRTGIVAASILGWARALGETIAVLLISGNALNIYPHSIFDPFSTLACTIAALLDGALTDSTKMAVHALAEVGLVLLAITMITNFGGRLLTRRFSDAGLPVGRGV
ncbi:MAG TPA: phosphate ABC transporter permease subunit PstC [Acidimicrobiales bacterium]|nr:phosphate ABC transporter permease subunit PstC [Acidimicrobiales bacterium]